MEVKDTVMSIERIRGWCKIKALCIPIIALAMKIFLPFMPWYLLRRRTEGKSGNKDWDTFWDWYDSII